MPRCRDAAFDFSYADSRPGSLMGLFLCFAVFVCGGQPVTDFQR